MASIAFQFPKIAARMANRQTQKFAEKVIPGSKTKMEKMQEIVAAMDKRFEKQLVSDAQKAGNDKRPGPGGLQNGTILSLCGAHRNQESISISTYSNSN